MQKMNTQVGKPLKSLGLRAFYIDREIPTNSAEMRNKYIQKGRK